MRRVLERLTSCFEILRTWGKKHAPVFAFTLLIVGGVFLFGHHASAEPSKVQSAAGDFLSWGFKAISWALGNFLTIVVIPTLLAAMNFSDIINAAPVVAGWVVVRDFTNLLFIIILLIISFGIIFGQDKYGKIDMLPQLFVVAIAINFSRTIVGFLNDISMVFMQTFVKAFSDAGAGNFVDLFSVDVSKDFTAPQTATGDAIASVVLANAAGMITLLVATIILGYLAVIMMIRIVVLWILVIIAPLAWFMKLAESWGDHTYAEWWKELKAQMVLGPIMAFFIWLALATGGAASVEFTNADVAGGKLGSGSWANNGSATTQAAIKAIIAVAILYKGLEIAQKQGGVGSSMLGKAQATAMKAARTGLKYGTGIPAIATLGSAGIRAGLRASGNETAQRYGKATSLTAPLMADVGNKVVGKLASKIPTGTVGAALGGAFVQRQLHRAQGAISTASEKMRTGDEEAYKKQVMGGSPESRAAILADLVSKPDENLSAAQRVQKKELVKMAQDDPEMLGKMSGEQLVAFDKTMMADIKAIKDPAKQRSAMHHYEESMAKSAHLLPTEYKDPATGATTNPQQAFIEHLDSSLKDKLSLDTITISPKKQKALDDALSSGDTAAIAKAQGDIDKERGRVRDNIKTLTKDPNALGRMVSRDSGTLKNFMQLADTDQIATVAKSGKIKAEHLEKVIDDKDVPAQNVVEMYTNMSSSAQGDVDGNEALRDSVRAKMVTTRDDAKARALASGNPADNKYDPSANVLTKQQLKVNIAVQANTVLKDPARKADGLKDTFGIGPSGAVTGANELANIRQVLSDKSLGADFLLNLDVSDVSGNVASEIGANMGVDVLAEIEKRITDGKLERTQKIKDLYAKLKTIPVPSGGTFETKMKNHPLVTPYV